MNDAECIVQIGTGHGSRHFEIFRMPGGYTIYEGRDEIDAQLPTVGDALYSLGAYLRTETEEERAGK